MDVVTKLVIELIVHLSSALKRTIDLVLMLELEIGYFCSPLWNWQWCITLYLGKLSVKNSISKKFF
jgi:hypothetical protein